MKHIGIIGLYGFCYGAFWSTTVSAFGVGFMFLATALGFRDFKFINRDRLLLLSLGFAGYLVLRTVYAIHEFPGITALHIKEATGLYQLGFIFAVVVALWMAQLPSRAYRWLLLVTLCGFFTRLFLHLDISELSHYLYSRPGFGMPTNTLGVYASIALLGLYLFSSRIWDGYRYLPKTVAMLLWLFSTAVIVNLILITQSRSAWIGCILVFPVVFASEFIIGIRSDNRAQLKRSLWGIAILLSMTMFSIFIIQPGQVKGRIQDFRQRNDPDVVKRGESPNSFWKRYYIGKCGLVQITERPVWGWGPGTAPLILPRCDGYPVIGRKIQDKVFKDFHSSYIQILFQIGIFGSLFMCCQIYLIVRSIWLSFRRHQIGMHMLLFLYGALCLFGIAAAGAMRTSDHLGKHFIWLFFGIAYAVHYRNIKRNEQVKKRGALFDHIRDIHGASSSDVNNSCKDIGRSV